MVEKGEEGDDNIPTLDWGGQIGYSPETFDELATDDFDEDQPGYKYYSKITKSPFALSLISEITTWKSSKTDKKQSVTHYSPFTVRTQFAFLKLIRNLTDVAEYLQNLGGGKERISELQTDLVFNLFQAEVDRIDAEKPQFFLVVEHLRRHAWAIRTRASGMDRERILQARRIIEQYMHQSITPSSPSSAESQRGLRERLGV